MIKYYFANDKATRVRSAAMGAKVNRKGHESVLYETVNSVDGLSFIFIIKLVKDRINTLKP